MVNIKHELEILFNRVQRVDDKLLTLNEAFKNALNNLDELEMESDEIEIIFYDYSDEYRIIKSLFTVDKTFSFERFKDNIMKHTKEVKVYKRISNWSSKAEKDAKLNNFVSTFVIVDQITK